MGLIEARERSGTMLSSDWVNVGEAAERVRVSKTAILRALAAGDLTAKQERVEIGALETWARSKRLIF